MRRKRVAVAFVATAACAASGETMTYLWTLTTDDGDKNIDVGESAYLSLWAHMDPEQVGFAGTIYDIVGIQNWDTGRLESYHSTIDSGWDHADDDNNIWRIEALQLPPLFNPDFIADNPIELYRIEWSTDDYTPRVVEVGDMNHLSNDVYLDDFGTSMSYEGVPGVATFTVAVPGAGVLTIPGMYGLLAARRRRCVHE